MDREEIVTIRESYIRCVSNHAFITAFYSRFMSASPVIQEKFKDVYSIKKTVMVTRGLNALINQMAASEVSEELETLAQQHNREHLNISPTLYPKYKLAVLETLEEFDPKFNDALKKLWEEVIDTGINYFIQHY